MNPEVMVTLKISVRDEQIVVTAVQTNAGEEQVLEIASGDETAVKELPPPPQLEALESVQNTELPPVPEVDLRLEAADFESRVLPDLPPVPEAPQPPSFSAFESLDAPELPPVPEAPQGETFQ